MLKYVSKIQHSLISKLIVSVGLMLLLSLATWAYMNTNYQKKKFMADIISNTDRLTNTVRLGAHYAMMLKMPEMEHAEDNMVTVEPGKSGEIIWRFARARVVDFACLQPGHYGAGMKGQVRVTRASGAPSAPASGGHGEHQH